MPLDKVSGKLNGWLTPSLLAMILVAVISGGWVMIQNAKSAVMAVHVRDFDNLLLLMDDRDKKIQAKLSELSRKIDDLRTDVLKNR